MPTMSSPTYSGDATYATRARSPRTTVCGRSPIAGGPYAVAEGASSPLTGRARPTAVTYGWDLDGDDDFTDATGETPTLTWAQLEALDVNDGAGRPTPESGCASRSRACTGDLRTAPLTVTNTAPASVLTGGLSATVGVPFTIKVGADDPSSADMAALFTYTVDWGDGSRVLSVDGPADPPVTHTYATAGEFEATFTATDKDGGTGPGTTVTVLVAAAPTASPTPNPNPTTDDPYDYDDYRQRQRRLRQQLARVHRFGRRARHHPGRDPAARCGRRGAHRVPAADRAARGLIRVRTGGRGRLSPLPPRSPWRGQSPNPGRMAYPEPVICQFGP